MLILRLHADNKMNQPRRQVQTLAQLHSKANFGYYKLLGEKLTGLLP